MTGSPVEVELGKVRAQNQEEVRLERGSRRRHRRRYEARDEERVGEGSAALCTWWLKKKRRFATLD